MTASRPAMVPLTEQWKSLIEKALAKSIPEDIHAPSLADAMRYSLLSPGKRVRPLLCIIAADTCGGDSRQALPAACAIEMIHAFSLIHDDLPCMDDDDLRRGQPTNHVVYGEATALLAGDALFAHAFEVLTSFYSGDTAATLCRILARASASMMKGQAMDMDAPSTKEASIDRLDILNEGKTGALIAGALTMGAVTAGGNDDQIAALHLFGLKTGLAFQIVDDLLDVMSTAKATGKRTGKDAENGKVTYPHLIGVDQCRKKVELLTLEALEELEIFADGAQILRDFTDTLLHRKS